MQRSDSEFSACPFPFETKVWRAIGLRAVDGDTIVVKLDRGWWDVSVKEIRLLGIDCWETNSGTVADREKGREARLFTQRLIVGRWLHIVTDMDTEKYGRILGSVRIAQTIAGGVIHPDLVLVDELRAAGYEKGSA